MTEKELDALLLRLGVKEEPKKKAEAKDKKKKSGKENTVAASQNNTKKENKSLHFNKKTNENTTNKQEKIADVQKSPKGKGKREEAKSQKNEGSFVSKNVKATPKNAKSPLKNEKPIPERSEKPNISHGAKPVEKKARTQKAAAGEKLRVMLLGGLQEIGKNITVLEYGRDIIVIDCGMGFPDEDMPGVDLVIPDFSYLSENRDRVRAILLTHGHEDHIGGVPYLLRTLSAPVYGTPLTLGILKRKLEEFKYEKAPKLHNVSAGDTVYFGAFAAEFIHVNHSIADSCAIAVHTPVGTVLHSGDFKLDVSPMDGQMMDVTRLGQLGQDGVKLLLCESTNAERSGYTPSERTVGSSLEHIFLANKKSRLIVATFSSNVHRVQQIINASARHGRRVAVLGRSMESVIGAARELGYMDIPDGVLINIGEIKRFRPEELTLITTGSQGEPMSALHRMAFGEHDRVKLDASDVVVISASAIPGNEKFVGKIVNALVKNGITVIDDAMLDVHVSGHACSEELKLMHALTRPEYFMPIHGEYRHLYAHKAIAEFMGMPADRIFVAETGKVLEIDEAGARFADVVTSGNVLVDGSGIGDVGSVVLRDRKHLAEDGLIVAVATIDAMSKSLITGPDLVTRGFVYVKESSDLMDEAREAVKNALESMLLRGHTDHAELKSCVKDTLGKLLFRKTKRKPMVLPVITEI